MSGCVRKMKLMNNCVTYDEYALVACKIKLDNFTRAPKILAALSHKVNVGNLSNEVEHGNFIQGSIIDKARY